MHEASRRRSPPTFEGDCSAHRAEREGGSESQGATRGHVDGVNACALGVFSGGTALELRFYVLSNIL